MTAAMTNQPTDVRTYRTAGGGEVQAVQITRENWAAVWEWADSKPFYAPIPDDPNYRIRMTGLRIFARLGHEIADFGDWVTRDAAGDFHACKTDLFAEIYTEVKP
jgi:hypothetical protein